LGLLSAKELLKDSKKNNKDKTLASPSPQQPHPEHFPNPNNPNDPLQQPRRTIQSANSNNSANKKGATRPLSANDVKKIHTYLKAANRSAHPIDSDKELHQLETMIIGRFLPPEQKWDATPNDNLFQSHYNHKNFYNRNQTIYPDANKPKYDSYKNYLIDRSVDILTVSQQQREENQKKRQQLQQQRPHSHNDYNNHSHQKKTEILILHSGDSHDSEGAVMLPGESFQKKKNEEEEENRDQDQSRSLFRPQSAPVLVLSYNSSPAKNKPPQQPQQLQNPGQGQGSGSGGGPLHRILESGESQDLDEKKEEQEEENLWRNWNPAGGSGNRNLLNQENNKKSMKSIQSSPNLLSSSDGSSSPLKQYLLNAKNVIGAIKTFRTGEEEENNNNNNTDSSTTAGVLSPSLKKNVSFTENVFVREFPGNNSAIGGNPLHNSSMRVVAPNNNKVVDKIVSLSDIKSPLGGNNNNSSNNNKSLGSVSRESFMSEITLEDPQDFAEKDYKSIRKAMTAMGAAQQLPHLRGSAGSGGSTSPGTLATVPVIAEEEKEQKERDKEKEMEIRRVKLPYRDFDGIPGASVLKSHLERNDYEEQLVKAHQTMISNRSGRTGRGGGSDSQPLTKPAEDLLLLDDELFEALNIELISHYDFPIRCDNICNSRILGKKKRENKKQPPQMKRGSGSGSGLSANNNSSSSVVQHNDIRNVGKVAFMIYETGYCIKGSAENYQIVHDYPHVEEVAETAKELLQEVLQKNPFSHDLLHTPMPNTKLFQQQQNNYNNINNNKEEKEKEKEDQNNNNNNKNIHNKIPSPTSSGKALSPPPSSSAHSSSFLAYNKLKNQNLDTSSAYLLTATGLLVAVYLLPHSLEAPTRNKAFHFFSLKDLYEIFRKYANDSSSCYSSQASDLLTIFDEIFSFGYPYGDNNSNNNNNNNNNGSNTGGNSSPAHAIGSRKSSKHNNSLSRGHSTVNNMSRAVSTNKMTMTSSGPGPSPASPPPSASASSLSPPPPLLHPSDSFVHQPLKKTSRQKSQVFLAGKTFIESSYHNESGASNNSNSNSLQKKKKKDVFIDQENEAGALVYPCLTDMTDQETLLSLIEILMNHIEIRRENDKEEEDEKEKELAEQEEEEEEEESVDYYCDESFEGNGIGKNHSPNHSNNHNNNNSNNNSPKKAKQMSKKKSGRKGKEKEKTEEDSLKIFV
jgi:hypothetical protein